MVSFLLVALIPCMRSISTFQILLAGVETHIEAPMEGDWWPLQMFLIVERPEAEPRWTHLGHIPLWKQRFGDRAPCGTSHTAKTLGRNQSTLGLQKFGIAFFSAVITQCAKTDTLSYCHSFPPVGEAVLATGWLKRVETWAVEQRRLKVQLSTFMMAGLTLSLRMPHLYLLFRVIICPTRVFVKVQIFK